MLIGFLIIRDYVGASEGVLNNDTDADGDGLTASLVTGPSNASVFTLNPDGSFTYTPVGNFTGTDTFTYQVSDGNGGTDTATATILVTAVNDAPVITNVGGDTLAYTEGNGAVVIDQGTSALVTDIDSANFDGGTLTVSFQAGSDSAEDILAVRNQGVGVGQISVQIGNPFSIIDYEGTTIGTFITTSGSGGSDLVIFLTSAATLVTEHLVNAPRVSFSAPLEVLGHLTRE